MLLTYDTLTRTPAQAMAAVYDFIGAPPFDHDFDHVDYAEEELYIASRAKRLRPISADSPAASSGLRA